jgi:hypothetical protein
LEELKAIWRKQPTLKLTPSPPKKLKLKKRKKKSYSKHMECPIFGRDKGLIIEYENGDEV